MVDSVVEAIHARTDRVLVLHGAGGYGKTTVAVDVAAAIGRDVWWVDAGTEVSLLVGLQAVAVAAGADPDRVRRAWSQGVGAAPDVLWEALEGRDADWLLVFDNADDPEVLTAGAGRIHQHRGWLRVPGERGAVLVTTRVGGATTWDGALAVRVGPLSSSSGAEVLLDLAPAAGSEVDARRLATRLGGLPLALRLAGSYLAAAHHVDAIPGLNVPHTFSDYLRVWEERFVELSDLAWDSEPAEERELLCRTWELSLDFVDRRGHSSGRALMRTLACLGRGAIPTAMLDPAVLAASPVFTGMTANVLRNTLIALGDVGLLEPGHTGSIAVVGMHPVIRDVNRYQARQNAVFRRTALSALTRITERITATDVATWPLWHSLVPHADIAVEMASDVDEPDPVRRASADACHEVAFFCERAGLDLRAVDLNQTAVSCRTDVLGPRDGKTLAAKHNLGTALRKVGRLPEAASAYREVLAAEREARGEAHEETLVTRCVLADVVRELGDLSAAETELRDIARIVGETPDRYDRSVLAVNLLLSRTLRERGRLAESEALLRAELAFAQDELGGGHEYTNVVLLSLATVVRDRGGAVEADRMARSAATAMGGLFGPEHERTLAARTHSASAMVDGGDAAGAVAEFRDILSVLEKLKGPEHPDVLGARRNLAVAVEESGDILAAEAEYRRLLDAEQRVYGGTATLGTRYSLASVLVERGLYDDAERMLRDVMAARDQSGATGDLDIQVRRRLATCLERNGDLAGAEGQCRAALELAGTYLSEDHPEVTRVRAHLGTILLFQGNRAEARKMLDEVHASLADKLGSGHRSVLALRSNAASALHSAGHTSAAIDEYRDILHAAREARHLDHPGMLHLRHNLAVALMEVGDLTEAEQHLRAALAASAGQVDDDYVDVVRIRVKLSEVQVLVGDLTEAEEQLARAVAALNRMRLDDSTMAREATYRLAMLVYQRDDLDEAEILLRRLLDVGRRVAEPDDELTMAAQLGLVSTLYRKGHHGEADELARELLNQAGVSSRDNSGIVQAATFLLRAARSSGV